MNKFTLEYWVFLCNFYVKCTSTRKSQMEFSRKFPWICVPHRNITQNRVNEVRVIGILGDRKPKHQCQILTKEV
jgi:hypothetical protein